MRKRTRGRNCLCKSRRWTCYTINTATMVYITYHDLRSHVPERTPTPSSSMIWTCASHAPHALCAFTHNVQSSLPSALHAHHTPIAGPQTCAPPRRRRTRMFREYVKFAKWIAHARQTCQTAIAVLFYEHSSTSNIRPFIECLRLKYQALKHVALRGVVVTRRVSRVVPEARRSSA
jgi:hypothetical protein